MNKFANVAGLPLLVLSFIPVAITLALFVLVTMHIVDPCWNKTFETFENVFIPYITLDFFLVLALTIGYFLFGLLTAARSKGDTAKKAKGKHFLLRSAAGLLLCAVIFGSLIFHFSNFSTICLSGSLPVIPN